MTFVAVVVGWLAHFHCHHDDLPSTGKLSPATFQRSAQQYGPFSRGRRTSLAWSTAAPIRIQVRTVSLDGISDATIQTWLMDTLVASAVSWLSSALSVIPCAAALSSRHLWALAVDSRLPYSFAAP